MDSVEFRGDGRDLDRFAQGALDGAVAFEELGPFERRMSWSIAGSSGFGSATSLRSGLSLVTTKLNWERPSVLSIQQAPTRLKFTLSRGMGPQLTIAGRGPAALGHGSLQISRADHSTQMLCNFADSGALELVALEVAPARLNELMGTAALPASLQDVLSSNAAHASGHRKMTPTLFRLLDEILYCDARGPSRQLHLEAKSLELLASIIDDLDAPRAASSPLDQHDIERLERARHVLLSEIDAPPSLPQLARRVGLNEVKLKTGFRALFGNSVYGYLRSQRLEEAYRLLSQGRLNVSEVAVRVGYDNPSKFSAAFRKQYGITPSALR